MGRPYFVMELVHGVPITEYCDKNKLTTKERLELFIPVCQAIQHAHQKGIIHRDIKPSNVMVTLHDGVPVPKVIDFGVAKATNQRLTEKTLFTHYAQMIGTPAYMSPEQAEMSGLDIDTRSDIYSLGVLLYELLTGSTPFTTKELFSKGYAEMQRIIAEQEPPKPSTRMSTLREEEKTVVAKNRSMDAGTLRRGMQGDLDWIVMKCLEKDRTRRYETSNGLAADLRRHLSNELITARPPTTGYLLKKLIKRNKVVFSAAAVLFAGVLLALAAFVYATIRVTRERNAKDVALGERGMAVELATRREAEAKEQLFVALRNQARAARSSRRAGQRLESLAALSQAAQIRRDENLRNDATAALALPDIRPGPSSEHWVPETRIVDFDDRYQRYAQLDKDGIISVFAIGDDHAIQRIRSGPTNAGWSLRLSPDGEVVAKLEGQRRLRVWRVADGRPALWVEPHGCSALAFTHDSRQFAVGQSNSIRQFDLVTGSEIGHWPVHTNIHQLAFDPENRRIAVGYSYSDVTSIYDATDGRLVADLPVGLMNGQIVAWHPAGEHLAIAGSDPRIQIWEFATRQQIARLAGHVQQVTDLIFHPMSGLLASYSWDGTLRVWEPWSGRELLQNPGPTWIRFSGDGQRLGLGWAGGNLHHLWEIVPNTEYRSLNSILPMDRIGLSDGDISPDGRWLVLGTQVGVQISELATGRIVAHLPTGASISALFLREGRSLVVCAGANLQYWDFEEVGLDRLRLGPPRTLPLPFEHPMRMSRTADGKGLAVVSEIAGQAVVLNTALDFRPMTTIAHQWAGSVAISGDGRWLATSGWNIDTVRLWDAQNGKLVHEWKGRPQSRVCFTPDHRELIICQGDGFTFWNVETGQLNRRLATEVALLGSFLTFSRDGRLMAMPVAPGVVELKDVATAKTLARLEDPFGDRSSWLALTPDNRKLVATAGYGRVLHVWELSAIRQRLAAMGFSDDWPGFPPLAEPQPSNRPSRGRRVTVEVLAASPATNAVSAAAQPNGTR